MDDIHLSDLGAPLHPMEASVENAEEASDQGKQKDVTEVDAKHDCKQGTCDQHPKSLLVSLN